MIARGDSRNAQKVDLRKLLHLYKLVCYAIHLQGESALPFFLYLSFCSRKRAVNGCSKDVEGVGWVKESVAESSYMVLKLLVPSSITEN